MHRERDIRGPTSAHRCESRDRPRLGASGEGPLPCMGLHADLFFSEDAGGLERAKALCAACPGRGACLAGAIERREPWGVWGGELFHAGTIVPRKRPRGRPRKRRVPSGDTAAPEAAGGTARWDPCW